MPRWGRARKEAPRATAAAPSTAEPAAPAIAPSEEPDAIEQRRRAFRREQLLSDVDWSPYQGARGRIFVSSPEGPIEVALDELIRRVVAHGRPWLAALAKRLHLDEAPAVPFVEEQTHELGWTVVTITTTDGRRLETTYIETLHIVSVAETDAQGRLVSTLYTVNGQPINSRTIPGRISLALGVGRDATLVFVDGAGGAPWAVRLNDEAAMRMRVADASAAIARAVIARLTPADQDRLLAEAETDEATLIPSLVEHLITGAAQQAGLVLREEEVDAIFDRVVVLVPALRQANKRAAQATVEGVKTAEQISRRAIRMKAAIQRVLEMARSIRLKLFRYDAAALLAEGLEGIRKENPVHAMTMLRALEVLFPDEAARRAREAKYAPEVLAAELGGLEKSQAALAARIRKRLLLPWGSRAWLREIGQLVVAIRRSLARNELNITFTGQDYPQMLGWRWAQQLMRALFYIVSPVLAVAWVARALIVRLPQWMTSRNARNLAQRVGAVLYYPVIGPALVLSTIAYWVLMLPTRFASELVRGDKAKTPGFIRRMALGTLESMIVLLEIGRQRPYYALFLLAVRPLLGLLALPLLGLGAVAKRLARRSGGQSGFAKGLMTALGAIMLALGLGRPLGAQTFTQPFAQEYARRLHQEIPGRLRALDEQERRAGRLPSHDDERRKELERIAKERHELQLHQQWLSLALSVMTAPEETNAEAVRARIEQLKGEVRRLQEQSGEAAQGALRAAQARLQQAKFELAHGTTRQRLIQLIQQRVQLFQDQLASSREEAASLQQRIERETKALQRLQQAEAAAGELATMLSDRDTLRQAAAEGLPVDGTLKKTILRYLQLEESLSEEQQRNVLEAAAKEKGRSDVDRWALEQAIASIERRLPSATKHLWLRWRAAILQGRQSEVQGQLVDKELAELGLHLAQLAPQGGRQHKRLGNKLAVLERRLQALQSERMALDEQELDDALGIAAIQQRLAGERDPSVPSEVWQEQMSFWQMQIKLRQINRSIRAAETDEVPNAGDEVLRDRRKERDRLQNDLLIQRLKVQREQFRHDWKEHISTIRPGKGGKGVALLASYLQKIGYNASPDAPLKPGEERLFDQALEDALAALKAVEGINEEEAFGPRTQLEAEVAILRSFAREIQKLSAPEDAELVRAKQQKERQAAEAVVNGYREARKREQTGDEGGYRTRMKQLFAPVRTWLGLEEPAKAPDEETTDQNMRQLEGAPADLFEAAPMEIRLLRDLLVEVGLLGRVHPWNVGIYGLPPVKAGYTYLDPIFAEVFASDLNAALATLQAKYAERLPGIEQEQDGGVHRLGPKTKEALRLELDAVRGRRKIELEELTRKRRPMEWGEQVASEGVDAHVQALYDHAASVLRARFQQITEIRLLIEALNRELPPGVGGLFGLLYDVLRQINPAAFDSPRGRDEFKDRVIAFIEHVAKDPARAARELKGYLSARSKGQMDPILDEFIDHLIGVALSRHSASDLRMAGTTNINLPRDLEVVRHQRLNQAVEAIQHSRDVKLKQAIRRVVPLLPSFQWQAGGIMDDKGISPFLSLGFLVGFDREETEQLRLAVYEQLRHLDQAVNVENELRNGRVQLYLKLAAYEGTFRLLEQAKRQLGTTRSVEFIRLMAEELRLKVEYAKLQKQYANLRGDQAGSYQTGLFKPGRTYSADQVQQILDREAAKASELLIAESIVIQVKMALKFQGGVPDDQLEAIERELRAKLVALGERIHTGEGIAPIIEELLKAREIGYEPVQRDGVVMGLKIAPADRKMPEGLLPGFLFFVSSVVLAPAMKYSVSGGFESNIGLSLGGALVDPQRALNRATREATGKMHTSLDTKSKLDIIAQYQRALEVIRLLGERTQPGQLNAADLADLVAARAEVVVLRPVAERLMQEPLPNVAWDQADGIRLVGDSEADQAAEAAGYRRLLEQARQKTGDADRIRLMEELDEATVEFADSKWTISYKITLPTGPFTVTFTMARDRFKDEGAVKAELGTINRELAAEVLDLKVLLALAHLKEAYLASIERPSLTNRRALALAQSEVKRIVDGLPVQLDFSATGLEILDGMITQIVRRRIPEGSRQARQLELDILVKTRELVAQRKANAAVTFPLWKDSMSLIFAGMSNVLSIVNLITGTDKAQTERVLKQLDAMIEAKKEELALLPPAAEEAPAPVSAEEVGSFLTVRKDAQGEDRAFLVKEVKETDAHGKRRQYFVLQPLPVRPADLKSLLIAAEETRQRDFVGLFGDPVVAWTEEEENGQGNRVLGVYEFDPVTGEAKRTAELSGPGLAAIVKGRKIQDKDDVVSNLSREFVLGSYTVETGGTANAGSDLSNLSTTTRIKVGKDGYTLSASGGLYNGNLDTVVRVAKDVAKGLTIGVGGKTNAAGGTGQEFFMDFSLSREGLLPNRLPMSVRGYLGSDQQYVDFVHGLREGTKVRVQIYRTETGTRVSLSAVQDIGERGTVEAGARSQQDASGGLEVEPFVSAKYRLAKALLLQINASAASGDQGLEFWGGLIRYFDHNRGQVALKAFYQGREFGVGGSLSQYLSDDVKMDLLVNMPISDLAKMAMVASVARQVGPDGNLLGVNIGRDVGGAWRAALS
ncbi:MAG: hypothetical protein HY598_02330, partial [Candidatus Omnitrophica bacterium]|nr:hypothetical protein [Candidatus Omnitrophota bacterium]